ncbi:MAG: EF-hand domain-containing protein [Halofilum sp. (in: g-proteobacteria)]|nr:EF-hand domain-containing protein [Halofilum sp. (in: g-proteobacteria)]
MKGASISTILGLLLLSVAILAASTGFAGGQRDEVRDRFEVLDADGDGRVTPAEARRTNAGLATHFDKFDRDGDGTLSLGEFRRHAQPDRAES